MIVETLPEGRNYGVSQKAGRMLCELMAPASVKQSLEYVNESNRGKAAELEARLLAQHNELEQAKLRVEEAKHTMSMVALFQLDGNLNAAKGEVLRAKIAVKEIDSEVRDTVERLCVMAKGEENGTGKGKGRVRE
jgi:DNA helicase TIP49 (TBP-interacting protein)